MDQLQGNVLSHTLSFLPWKSVVECRRVSQQWKLAAAQCPCKDVVQLGRTEDLASLGVCLPNVRSLAVSGATSALNDANFAPARAFRQLRHLTCSESEDLLLAFPHTILPSFRHLTELNVSLDMELQWQLQDLEALPQLRVLRAVNNWNLTGQLDQLRSQDFTVLEFSGCRNVQGNLLDLARFPQLQEVSLNSTAVSGDVREVGEGDFPALQEIGLSSDDHFYGIGALSSIRHAFAVMRGRYFLTRNSTAVCPLTPFPLYLDSSSPDFYYGRPQQRLYASELDPPFSVETIVAGNLRRRGYRWSNLLGGCCDIVWFDPEPSNEDGSSHAAYLMDLEIIMEDTSTLFQGMTEPPSLETYRKVSRSHSLGL